MRMSKDKEPKSVDVRTCEKIQSKVADYNHTNAIYEENTDTINPEYTESFIDHCVTFWEEAGYDRAEVIETVDAAVEELKRVHA